MAETCSFPDCHCPMDPGPDPDWCARRLPKPAAKQVGTSFRKQAEEVAASVRQGVLQRAAQILRRSGQVRLASEVAQVASGGVTAAAANPLEQLRALVANDSHAMTFQSMGQYRSALLKAIDEANRSGQC